MSYGLSLFAEPADEPLTVDEVKEHLWSKEDRDKCDTSLDAHFARLILAARQIFEDRTNRQVVTATWDLKLDRFPLCEIELPKAPLQSVTSITYVDLAGDTQTWASGNYIVDTSREPGRIVPAYGKYWPSTRHQANSVSVRFVAGYGTPANVPQSIKTAIKGIIEWIHDNCTAEMPACLAATMHSMSYGDEFVEYGI